MILEQHNLQYGLTVPLADGWTLEAVAFGGPHHVSNWRVTMACRDQVYRVVTVRPGAAGDPPVEKSWYSGNSNDEATEWYLKAVSAMTREAQGLPALTDFSQAFPGGE